MKLQWGRDLLVTETYQTVKDMIKEHLVLQWGRDLLVTETTCTAL